MPSRSFVTFWLEDRLYGVDILTVREINRQLDLTPVPHAPEYISGLINLRGQIVTVIDLKRRLGMGRWLPGKPHHNIILKSESDLRATVVRSASQAVALADKVGLLVDEIDDVCTVDDSEIESPPANASGPDGRCVTGVIKLEKTLLSLLSLKEILLEGMADV